MKGSYLGLRFTKQTELELHRICVKHGVPNIIKPSRFHTTITYSREYLPELKEHDIPHGFSIKAHAWDVFKDNDKRCLVLKLDSWHLQNRHNWINNNLGAKWDFPTYEPHITVSYNIGDYDITNISKELDIKVMPYSEYVMDLDLKWEV